MSAEMKMRPRRNRHTKGDSSGNGSCVHENYHTEWTNEVIECPVYHPLKEEFDDPLDYLQKIAPEASKYGICKIVPPLICSITPGIVLTKEKKGFKFTTRVQPLRLSEWNTKDKNTFFMSGRNYTLHDFESMANKVTADRYCISGCLPSAYVEREFWHQLTVGNKGTVEYGINVDGSAFSCSFSDELGRSKWNLRTLPRLPKSTLRLMENAIRESQIPCSTLGCYLVCLHGMSKIIICTAFEFEKVAQYCIYTPGVLSSDGTDGAFDLLAEKTTMFSPKILLQHHVPVYKAVQLPGEFVITFPRAYHAGFSHGFNCGEAVNFATGDWFPFGAEATQRYARLSMMPIVPYEELLCKEAMHLLTTSSHENKSPTCPVSSRFVKVSFVCLIRSHHSAHLCLKRSHRSLRIAPNVQGAVFCGLCKRDCYVAHFNCNCNADPICLFHEMELCNCHCGSNCILSLRGDMPEMEAVVRKFEEEEGLLQDVEQQMKHNNSLWTRKINPYTQYCEGHGRNLRKRRKKKNVQDHARTREAENSKVKRSSILSNEQKWTRMGYKLRMIT